MPLPLLPIAGAAIGAGARFVGGQLLKQGAKRMTGQALRQQAIKQGAVGASGMGILSASPAQAPGAPRDSARVSAEAVKPETPSQSIPNFGAAFGP
ncbi:hypothetical protein JST97_10545 [bacterium]|nr:hypothetical protein [bacterium]